MDILTYLTAVVRGDTNGEPGDLYAPTRGSSMAAAGAASMARPTSVSSQTPIHTRIASLSQIFVSSNFLPRF